MSDSVWVAVEPDSSKAGAVFSSKEIADIWSRYNRGFRIERRFVDAEARRLADRMRSQQADYARDLAVLSPPEDDDEAGAL